MTTLLISSLIIFISSPYVTALYHFNILASTSTSQSSMDSGTAQTFQTVAAAAAATVVHEVDNSDGNHNNGHNKAADEISEDNSKSIIEYIKTLTSQEHILE